MGDAPEIAEADCDKEPYLCCQSPEAVDDLGEFFHPATRCGICGHPGLDHFGAPNHPDRLAQGGDVAAEPERIGLPLEEMKLLPFVQWDRYTEGPEGVSTAFGWISRPDGRADFVLLRPTREGCGVTTSSAEYSEAIGTALNDGEPTGEHQPCLRVEAAPEAAGLPNVVRLCPCCASGEEAEDPGEFYHPATRCGVCGHPGPAHVRPAAPGPRFGVGQLLAEELGARGWSTAYLASLMGGDPAVNQLSVDLLIHDGRAVLDAGTASGLEKALNVSAQFWMNYDSRSRRAVARFGERIRGLLAHWSFPVESRKCLERLAAEIDADRDHLQAGLDSWKEAAGTWYAKAVRRVEPRDLRQRIEEELRPAVMLVRIPGSARETEVVALEGVFSALAEIAGKRSALSGADAAQDRAESAEHRLAILDNAYQEARGRIEELEAEVADLWRNEKAMSESMARSRQINRDLRRRIEEEVTLRRRFATLDKPATVVRDHVFATDLLAALAEIFGPQPAETVQPALFIRSSVLQRAVISACSCGGQTEPARQCPACIVYRMVRAEVQPEESYRVTNLVTVCKDGCSPRQVPEDQLAEFVEVGWLPEEQAHE